VLDTGAPVLPFNMLYREKKNAQKLIYRLPKKLNFDGNEPDFSYGGQWEFGLLGWWLMLSTLRLPCPTLTQGFCW